MKYKVLAGAQNADTIQTSKAPLVIRPVKHALLS